MIDIFQWRSSIGSWYCQNVKGTSNCTAPGWIESLWYRDQEVDNLTFFLVFLLLLLIISGDVELNPGPKTDISNVLKKVPNKHILINLLAGMSHMWREIGLALNVEPNFLHGLSSSSDSNEVKLANVIENWMNTQSSPITWEKVISAIEGPIVGHNKSKADELRHHLETSIVLQNGEPTTFSEHIDMETHSLLLEEQSERNSDLGLEDDEKTSEILTSHSSTTSGKAIPLCLPNNCVWDEKSKTYTIKQIERNSLVINEEAVKILEGITNPICVIAVVGPYRSGKSYLLNQLIRSKESRFELGHTTSSKTKGIWMWDTPFQHTLKSGRKVAIILLDTEGVDAVKADSQGDTQVFTLSVLLSSLLVYNSNQVPKRENLNQMTFIINLAKSISYRGSAAISSFKRIAPSFLWILRDALLQPVNSQEHPCSFRDYLLDILSLRDRSADDTQTQATKCFLEFFDSLDAEMMPPPSFDPQVAADIDNPRYREKSNPEFFQRIEQVCDKILKESKPKRGYTEGSLMNGMQFTEMLKIYVDELNSEDGIPRIGSAWDQAMKNLYESAIRRAKEMYKKAMSDLQFPIEEDEIEKHHKEAYEQSMELFKKLTELDGDRDANQKNFDELAATFATYFNGSCNGGLFFQYCEDNKQESQKHCQELLGKLRHKHLNPFLENLSHKTTDQEISTVIDEIEKAYKEQSKGPAQEDEIKNFKESLHNEVKRLIRQMKKYDEQQKSQLEQYEKENLGVKNQLQSEKSKHETEVENYQKSLEKAEQTIKELSQQKNNDQQTKINLEARLKELQACSKEQQRINENHQKTITTLKIVLVFVCVILVSVIIYR